ncbi:MAG TPA: ABC transporter permease [candidate division Zixibacteria bacterium]|nr:ABC transporter permease [candidate division Zixibacteria bacterium]HER00379.1 ABC transporter permease [candidate division Zixibacteria bacterium]
MKFRNIRTIYGKEMKDTLRDRRTLIFMLIVPIVAIPLLIMFTSSLMVGAVTKAQEERATVVFEGFDNLPADLQDTFKAAPLLTVKTENDYADTIDLIDQLKAGGFDALVSVPDYFGSAIESESPTSIDIFYDQAELKSEFAVDKIRDILEPYEDKIVAARLQERQMSVEIISPFEVNRQNVASAQKVAGRELGGILPYLIIIMCFMGAMYPAIDLAAGEKERGTLETLLVSPASRGEFVIGKYLVVLTTGIVAALLSMVSLTFSLNYMVNNLLGDIASELLRLQFNLETVTLIILIILPLAGIFASVLLSVSIFARSFKEAQSYITALNMLVILPAFVSLLPGIEIDYKMALIPVINVSLIIKNAISGSVEWNYVGVAFISTLVLALLALLFCKKWFERESVIFRM